MHHTFLSTSLFVCSNAYMIFVSTQTYYYNNIHDGNTFTVRHAYLIITLSAFTGKYSRRKQSHILHRCVGTSPCSLLVRSEEKLKINADKKLLKRKVVFLCLIQVPADLVYQAYAYAKTLQPSSQNFMCRARSCIFSKIVISGNTV